MINIDLSNLIQRKRTQTGVSNIGTVKGVNIDFSGMPQITPRSIEINKMIEGSWKAQEEAAKQASTKGILKEALKPSSLFAAAKKVIFGVGKGIKEYTTAIAEEPTETAKGIAETAVLEPIEFAEKILQPKTFAEEKALQAPAPELTTEQQKARQVGEFLGWLVPYSVITKGTKIGLTAITKAPKIAKYIPVISDLAGFVGTGQVLHEDEEGSRLKQLRNDVILLGAFKAAGAGFKALRGKPIEKEIDDVIKEYKIAVSGAGEEVKVPIRIERKLLPERTPKPETIVGKEFTMRETAERGAIQRARAFADYNKELAKYNTNPNPKQLEIVKVAKKKRDEAISGLEVKIKQINEKIVKETGKTPKQHVSEDIVVGGKELAAERQISVPEIKPTKVEVPPSMLPVGEGRLKVSRLEARMKGLLDTSPEEARQLGLSTYREATGGKERIAKLADYVTNNTDDAMAVLRGEKDPPKGFLRNDVFVALSNSSVGDRELAGKISSYISTRFGQEIETLKNINPNSPVRYMTDLMKGRIEIVGGKEKVKGIVSQKVKEGKAILKKNHLNKDDWETFISEIVC